MTQFEQYKVSHAQYSMLSAIVPPSLDIHKSCFWIEQLSPPETFCILFLELSILTPHDHYLLWVTCPDILCDHTLSRYSEGTSLSPVLKEREDSWLLAFCVLKPMTLSSQLNKVLISQWDLTWIKSKHLSVNAPKFTIQSGLRTMLSIHYWEDIQVVTVHKCNVSQWVIQFNVFQTHQH